MKIMYARKCRDGGIGVYRSTPWAYKTTKPKTTNPKRGSMFTDPRECVVTACPLDVCVGRGEFALALLTAETFPRSVLSTPQMFLIEPTRPGRLDVLITSCWPVCVKLLIAGIINHHLCTSMLIAERNHETRRTSQHTEEKPIGRSPRTRT